MILSNPIEGIVKDRSVYVQHCLAYRVHLLDLFIDITASGQPWKSFDGNRLLCPMTFDLEDCQWVRSTVLRTLNLNHRPDNQERSKIFTAVYKTSRY